MNNFYRASGGLCCCLFALLALTDAVAQSEYQVSHTIDGQPDLQGVWANNSITPVERPDMFEDRAFLNEEELDFLKRRLGEIQAEADDALFGEQLFYAAFSGNLESGDPTTGNYDQFWMSDRSVHNRTSQIIDPPTGKYPRMTEAARAKQNRYLAYRQPGFIVSTYLDLPADERCISYGAPYLNSGYNSYWQIVQSKEHVVILQEMMHDARIVPLTDKPHAPEAITLWHGDSRGYWDGNTLVVETRNYSDKSSWAHNNAVLNVERFTRVGENSLRYQLTSYNPYSYTAPYTREVIFSHSEDPIYEYACHEGNYAMPAILRGSRVLERQAAQVEN